VSARSPWVDDANAALLTDLYQLTMAQAYWKEGVVEEAVFSLYFRELPAARNFVLACGLDDVLHYLETLRFEARALEDLQRLDGSFCDGFLTWLSELRFRGAVRAVAEGVPVFPDVPLLEVTAPIVEAQLVESFVMNQIHVQSVLATKAVRVVTAAAGRPVVDFAMRRTHGADAALKGARACHIAGVAATSNVLAGLAYGIPVRGTMAHSYIEAHDREIDAFRAFAELYPGTIILVDTYDTMEGVRKVIELAHELGDEFSVRGIRLDSGNLADLARKARELLDAAGLGELEIFASGSLDEYRVAELVTAGVPIDGFGVGTRMGVSRDAPDLELAYKLTGYAGEGRTKTSPGKPVLPGPKQVFRVEEAGCAVRDVVARHDEELPGRPLLAEVMRDGRRLAAGRVSLEQVRARAASELARLPSGVRALAPANPPYPVEVSQALRSDHKRVLARVRRAASEK
jgi:nicotinate phosphoribosyltransferase